jgi:signal transduction histidine kinase
MTPRVALALAGLLLAAGLATASTQPGSAGVLESTYGLDVTVPVSALRQLYQQDPGQQLPVGGVEVPQGQCGQDRFTLNQTGDWFRFREGSEETGCGEVRFSLDLPPGVASAVVRFRADRSIQQASNQPLAYDMQQELRTYDEHGALAASFPYYNPADPPHLLSSAFSYPVELKPDQTNLTIGWLFRDRGGTVGQNFVNPVFGQSFSATVQDATIELNGMPLVPDSIEQQRLGVQGESVRYLTTLAIRVPDSIGVSGRMLAQVRVADGLQFARVLGPRGETVEPSLLKVSDVDGVRTVLLTGNATAAHGAGVYRIDFTSATPISPSALLYPFIVAIMVVPVGAGALAWRNTNVFRRQATPEFAATAANLERVVLAMIGVYLLLPAGVLLSGRLALLASWPLEGEAGLVYLLIGLAFVGFLAVGFVGRRHLSHLMLEEATQKDKARRELERSNRELAEFAYVASHDLQEPLRTVASYTQLLQRRYKGRLDSDADEFIDSAVEGAQRMQGLIQDLLAYSRVGAKPEADVPVDLNLVLDEVRKNLHQALIDAGATVNVPHRLPTVVGHDRQFVQLLQNLLGNALKFRDKERACRIEVGSEPVPGGWRISVKDNGIGIEPRHFERIFQIFQRLHARDEYPGTGIGLAICKRIVELAGGRIGVESTPGQGSTFWFTIPQRETGPGSATATSTAGAQPV